MVAERKDPVTGRKTTGHEWNGIEELNTPIPRTVLFFLAASLLFSIVYWILMPAWPVGATYTKGILDTDQRAVVEEQVKTAAERRAVWTDRIAKEDLATIAADPALMQDIKETGHRLFVDNCAACHGTRATGGPGFPDLADGDWLWGGDPETIAETIRVGINSTNDDTRMSQMMAFGHDGILTRQQVDQVAAYVRSLSGQTLNTEETAALPAGKTVFADNCAACHGDTGHGIEEMGAPNLTDKIWLYGGDAQTVHTTIFYGRQGHMPHWSERLSPTDIKILALYVKTLGDGKS